MHDHREGIKTGGNRLFMTCIETPPSLSQTLPRFTLPAIGLLLRLFPKNAKSPATWRWRGFGSSF
jgi:hypothetical protein